MRKVNKIFGIGFRKTGTTSLKRALQILGFPTLHHVGEIDGKPVLIQKVIEEEMKKNVQILSTWKEYRGFLDFQGYRFYRKLDEAYPNSKFIYTRREPREWIKSAYEHKKKTRNRAARIRLKQMGFRGYRDKEMHRLNRYEKEIKAYFKERPNDFLIMNICAGEGWERLCLFLGVPVPEIEFPHLNKRRTVVGRCLGKAKKRVKEKFR
ncbi:MAG: hypothetical protein GF333_01555 [Candidatus Omnitrophica bacterium]|nr:hypothetical protein [Candidatus Omnitrophota bacterium]